jgi:hypothetical protein
MSTPNNDILIRAVEDARRVLGEYIAPGPRDATRTLERLLAILARDDVVHALDRIKRRRTIGRDRRKPSAVASMKCSVCEDCGPCDMTGNVDALFLRWRETIEKAITDKFEAVQLKKKQQA